MKKWFRIQLHADGSIDTAVEVEAAERNGKHVRYVEAVDKAKACELVVQWFIRYRRANNERSRRHKERLAAAGRCVTCGLSAAPDKTLCEACMNKATDRNLARYEAKKNGTYVAPVPLSELKWPASKFKAWLKSEIGALEALRDAARVKPKAA